MEDLNREKRERRLREKARISLIKGTNNKKHICETLRLIYDQVHEKEGNDEIVKLLIDAMTMAKKMQNRLAYYQKTYKDNTGNKAINVIGLEGVRARSRMRKAREL